LALAFATTIFGVCALTATSQPPEGRSGPGGKGKKGGPAGFELGKVLPPFVREELDLTDEQEKAIAELEQEVKGKLEKVLTAEQRQRAESARPPMGPPKGKGSPKGKKDGPPSKGDGEQVHAGGIQWFATWEAGKAEAERTGRPILFVSAAPHCAGVSGIW
jgi:hypothetical protein